MRNAINLVIAASLVALVPGQIGASVATAQEGKGKAGEGCNLVHVPVIKDIQLKYDGMKSIEITVTGEVPTAGYKGHVLIRRVYVMPPADGIWEYDMFTCKPGGIVAQVITPVVAKETWESPPRNLKGIQVYGSKEPKEVAIKWP